MSLLIATLRLFCLSSLLVGLLAACGGGGGGAGNESSTAPATGPIVLSSTVITGIAANGAPLGAAAVRVKDASGASVTLKEANGQTVLESKTSVVDGSFRLTLANDTQRLPLLLQVTGVDATGAPVTLHSALTSAAPSQVVHLTPMTEAVLALVFGTEPWEIWAKAEERTDVLANLLNTTAMTAASDLLKTVIKSNLTDAKIADAKVLDFFRDAAFRANKTGLDMALEQLRPRIVKNAQNAYQLQLSNKFAAYGAPEVTIELPTAKTELFKTGGAVANAISSSTKTTTVPTGVATALATIDTAGVALNALIAQGASSAGFAASSLLSGTGDYAYVRHDGKTRDQLLSQLADYAQKNWQLGRLTLSGCADDPVPTKGCVRYAVSAQVVDTAGRPQAVFRNVLSYKAGTQTVPAQWFLVGNNRDAEFQVRPALYAEFDTDGKLLPTTASRVNPRAGVTIDFVGSASIQNAYVQTPGNFSLRYSSCGRTYLCMNKSSTASVTATGGISDTLIDPPTLSWVGSRDTLAGAAYQVSYGSPATVLKAVLPMDVPASLENIGWPTLVLMPPLLNKSNLLNGAQLNWSAWAASNPQMRLKEIRLLSRVESSGVVTPVASWEPALGEITRTLPAQSEPAEASSYQLLLIAQDQLGRQVYSLLNIPNTN